VIAPRAYPVVRAEGREVAVIVGGVIVALAGMVVIGVAVLGWKGRLPRNFVAGVRTPGTMRSDEAFRIANKVAAPLAVAGGAVLVAGGIAGAAMPVRAGGPTVLATVGVAVVLILIGAVQGARAARAAP
jgi:uncharacterized membrane protein